MVKVSKMKTLSGQAIVKKKKKMSTLNGKNFLTLKANGFLLD